MGAFVVYLIVSFLSSQNVAIWMEMAWTCVDKSKSLFVPPVKPFVCGTRRWFLTFARIFNAVTSGVIMTLWIEHHTAGKVTSLVKERGLIGFALPKSFAYWDEWGRAGRSKLVFPLTHSTINILGERRDKTANEKQKTGISIDWWLLGWLRALTKARRM